MSEIRLSASFFNYLDQAIVVEIGRGVRIVFEQALLHLEVEELAYNGAMMVQQGSGLCHAFFHFGVAFIVDGVVGCEVELSHRCRFGS